MHRPSRPADFSLSTTFAQAMAAWEAGNLAEARRLGRRIVEHRPEFGGGHYLLGLIAQRQGLTRKAVEFLTRAVEADPTQPVPRLALGRALETQGDDAGAQAQYHALLAADPAHAEAQARLGEILARHGRRDEAIAACRAAIAAHPRHAEALCRLGALLHEAGRSAEAAGILERALALRPDWPTALHDYGLALIALDRLASAETILAGAMELRPGHAPTLTALATALRRQRRFDAAGERAEQAVQIAPQVAAGWLELGLIRAAQGLHDGAAAAFERAVGLQPDATQAHWCLAESCRALGQDARAIEHYRLCLRLDPADRVGAALGLAQLDADALPDRAPDAYVRQLFDDYAPRFESALVGHLGYRGPERIAALLDRHCPEARGGLAILDAGCGTGLAGPVLRPRATRLDGIDLSPAMIEHAARRGLYDRLDVGELTATLAARPGEYDLIAAADVLVYFGDLAPLLGAAAAALRPGGLFVATLERDEGDRYRLGPASRYAHGAAYLTDIAARAGFVALSLDPTVTRQEAGADVPGWAWALRKA